MSSRFSQLLLISCLFIFAGLALAAEPVQMQARIYIDSKAQFLQLRAMNLDQVWQERDYIEIITTSSELSRIQSLGFRTEVIIDDIVAFNRSRLTPDKDMGGYKTLDEINAYIDQLILFYPALVSNKISIGQTLEGRPTWAVKISDNPNVDEDEIEILYTSAIHSREVITPEVLFYFMDHLLSNYGIDTMVTRLIDNREMWFILNVNPDGYYRNQVTDPGGGGMWRKNRRNNGDGSYGIDINRNYGHAWGYDDVGSSPSGFQETYRGTGPFSEPETQNMRDFITAHNFVITLYYHSYSNLILWPWGYIRSFTPEDEIFSQMGDSIAAYNGYSPGPSWTLYLVNGDSDDWGYGEQTTKNKNFALTIEVGSYDDNFWPPLNRKPQLISENLQGNLFIARVAERVYQLASPKAPVVILPDTVNRLSYSVDWSLDDTLNPAVSYELVELQNKARVIDSARNWNNWTNNGLSISNARYHSNNSSFYSGAQNSTVKYFTSKNPLFVQTGDTLRFWAYYDIETDFDYAYVEISTDGLNFTPIAGNITTNYNPNQNNRGNGITGLSTGWVQAIFDLGGYAGSAVFIRFTYETDSYVVEEGIYFDDFYPIEAFGTETVVSSVIADTTFAFADRPAGTYYYKVRALDAQNQWSDFSNVKATFATSSGFVCGDASGNGIVNILDITYLISYLYKGGPDPLPPGSGDANGNGIINILDGTYLIGYLYKGGPAPICP